MNIVAGTFEMDSELLQDFTDAGYGVMFEPGTRLADPGQGPARPINATRPRLLMDEVQQRFPRIIRS